MPNPLWCYKCQKYGPDEDNCRWRAVCGKCGQQNPDHHINDCQFLCKFANCGGDHLVYARSCESWRQEKEVLTVKHQNNIPYNEAHKLVIGSKTASYTQAVQPNKSPYNKYEMIVKTLIQLELGEWESFINKIKASLNTTRAGDVSTRSVDLAENKEESSAQIQTQLGKTDKEEKTAITPTTRPIKHPVTRSPTKSRSKDRRSPKWPPTTNKRSQTLEKIINSNNLCFHNQKSQTHLDYILCHRTVSDPLIYVDYNCCVYKDSCGSDPYPIMIIYLYFRWSTVNHFYQ